jgi:hypothetical protein
MCGKIGRDHIYGVPLPEASESEERWRDINASGGRLFLCWGLVVILVGLVGLASPPDLWFPYIWVSFGIIIGGLLLVVRDSRREAGKRPQT